MSTAVNALCIVLVMEATTSPLVSSVTPAWLARCATACATQLNRDVAPIYGGQYSVRVAANPKDVKAGEMVLAVVDTLPDAPGDIAYHSDTGADLPVAFLALSTCNSLDDVSTAISHEVVETAGDASCNLWADDGAGSEHCRETCDAVESNGYYIDLGDGQPIKVSDFLLPAFFGAGAPPPYSFMAADPVLISQAVGVPEAPFAVAPGGYEVKRASGTGEMQVTAHAASKRGAIVAAGKHHWSSRPARRGVPMTVEVAA